MNRNSCSSDTASLILSLSQARSIGSVAVMGVLSLFVLMSCATSTRPELEYHPVQDVLPSDSYTTRSSSPSGDLLVSGPGNRAVLSSGISGFSLNGDWHDFENPPVYRKGQLHLSESDAETFRTVLSSSSTERNRTTTEKKGREFTVVVDPGHGGKFVGARGINGQLEKDLNLIVAQHVRNYLNGENTRVKLTRSSDTSLSTNHKRDLDRRVQIADRKNADLFVSIHANAARNSSASGFELYVSPDEDRYETIQRLKSWHPDPSNADGTSISSSGYQSYAQMYRDHRRKSKQLARIIRRKFKQVVPTGSRGVKSKSLHVLRNAPCPAVLVELGFMTNRREANLLSRPSYQRKLGRKIAEAIETFRRSLAHYDRN